MANPIPIQVPDWQLQSLAEGRASLIIVPVDFGGVFDVKTAKYDGGKWTFKTEYLIIEGAAKYQVGGVLDVGKLSLRVVSVNCIQFGQITGDDERKMGWQNDVPMPAIFEDDDWCWAINVRAIAPF
jgi:hypothetical protein